MAEDATGGHQQLGISFAGVRHRVDGVEMLAGQLDDLALLSGHGQELQPTKMALAVANHSAQFQVFLLDLNSNGCDFSNLECPRQCRGQAARADVGGATPHFVLLARTKDGQCDLTVERVAYWTHESGGAQS